MKKLAVIFALAAVFGAQTAAHAKSSEEIAYETMSRTGNFVEDKELLKKIKKDEAIVNCDLDGTGPKFKMNGNRTYNDYPIKVYVDSESEQEEEPVILVMYSKGVCIGSYYSY